MIRADGTAAFYPHPNKSMVAQSPCAPHRLMWRLPLRLFWILALWRVARASGASPMS